MIDVSTPDGVRGLFSTRVGGVSVGYYSSLNLGPNTDDARSNVRENWRILAEASGLATTRLVANRQVHGTQVHVVEQVGTPASVEADALVTERVGVGLLALGADCLPILVWRTDGRAVGAVHAGWRGVLGGVIGAAVTRIGGGPFGAAVGPGIGSCCYPVGDDVRDAFEAEFGASVVEGSAIAVSRAAVIALIRAGLRAKDIQVVNRCTACEPEHFFSYRRDGPLTGRQVGLVWRT